MIDLHLHLDGSLTPGLVLELGREQNLELPCRNEAEAAVLLSVPADCENLNDYLKCFDLPVRVLQNAQALERAAYELGTRLAAQGLLYAEIRFAPQLHTEQGLTQWQAVEAARGGLRTACRENPGFSAQLILCCMRGAGDEANRKTLEAVQKYLGDGVCAADLAGAEALYPTASYRELFGIAASLELPFTVHAGEAAGPQSIWDALSFGARRIGHGVRCTEDVKLMEFLAREKIPLELCFTSNLQTKAVSGPKEFPIRRLLQQGIRATLNTDNMTVSNVTLAEEYRKLESLGLERGEKRKLLENAAEAAFVPPPERQKLLAAVKAK